MTIDDLPLACSYWLRQSIAGLIPGINEKISAMYEFDSPALFDENVVVGELTNVDIPTICTYSDNGSEPEQLDMTGDSPESASAIVYKIRVVLPKVADGSGNTVSNFELSKQCALGALWLFFWDKRNTLQLRVSTKFNPDDAVSSIANSRACGPWRSLHLKPLTDETTLVRSAEMSFTFLFAISDDAVLDSDSAQ